MPSREFPYRPILEELTDVASNEGLDPYEAYEWLRRKRRPSSPPPDTYCSTSITSGGHARDNSLEMREIIERNTNSARLLADQLAADQQLDPATTIEPVFVGKTHWNQAEYMEFWLSVIGGYELTSGFLARDIDILRRSVHEQFEAIDLDIDLMISGADAEARAQEYFRMSSVFANLIKKGMPAIPMKTLIRMIDTELSLGAQTERAFARQLGARVMNICIVKPAVLDDLKVRNHILARDTEALIKFGAVVFDTKNNDVRLTLEEDEALQL